MRDPKRLSDLIVLPVPGADWTDAQWAERDAMVAEARQKAEAAPHAIDRAAIAAVRGFPLRAATAALVADMAAGPMAALAAWHGDHPGDGIAVLSGPPGCGKTVAATWWGMQVGAICVRAATFATTSRYESDDRAGWLKARSMVLDDLGTEYNDAKGSFNVDLDDLIDVKYGSMHRLVITTNLPAAAFKSRYGERVADRIRECGAWIEFNAKSLRRKS